MIIGLSGKAQSGKDTVYKMIVYAIHYWRYYNRMKQGGFVEFKEDYSLEHMKQCEDFIKGPNQGVFKYSFAYYLKAGLAVICDCNASDFESIDFKNSKVPWLDITYRELLQKFGTAIRNEVCGDFWVKAVFKDINLDDQNINVFTDVRFKSEAVAVKERGGVLVRINRKDAGAGNHVSETELDDYKFDIIINNDGNLEDLLEQVRVMLQNLCLI